MDFECKSKKLIPKMEIYLVRKYTKNAKVMQKIKFALNIPLSMGFFLLLNLRIDCGKSTIYCR